MWEVTVKFDGFVGQILFDHEPCDHKIGHWLIAQWQSLTTEDQEDAWVIRLVGEHLLKGVSVKWYCKIRRRKVS